MEDESERGDLGSPEEIESPGGQELPEDQPSLDELFSATYEELRRLASTVKRYDASLTLNPTALVHEVWIKLAKSPPFALMSPLHFKRIAARAMRRVLVDAARHRNAHKRGSEAVFVTLDDSIAGGAASNDDLLALNEAMEELERLEPRQALMVELRFFAGLTVPETAEVLGVDESSVHRDWRAARAWLTVKLRGTG